MEQKICTKCGETKAVECFSNYPNSNLLRAQCLQCLRDYAKQHGKKNRARLSAQARIRRWKKRGLDGPPEPQPEPTIKTCLKCGEEKAAELFPINYRNGRRKSPCKACSNLHKKVWRDANKEKLNARARERAKGERQKAMAYARKKRYRARVRQAKNAGPS